MFLIGISGSILPYLVLLGVVVMLSVHAEAPLCENRGNTAFNASEKQLVYEYPDIPGSDYTGNDLVIDFYSSNKHRGKSSCKQQLFSFVEFLSTFAKAGVNVTLPCFFSKIFVIQNACFRFFGLSPPSSGFPFLLK